jgi:hypothetical protein
MGLDWRPIHKFTEGKCTPVLLYSPAWVDGDFCPKGVREGFLTDDEGWISAKWDGHFDDWIAVSNCEPTHWAPMPSGPAI